ncbi:MULTISPECIES: 23S rRNA (pseudouridine(1915)-N(3))-methyltransferase RlmH [Prochlorococcus]|uniref:Ribosomal RNA large subunit methyltransferase H n=1 Tax=Prochlorococcus marinus (strain SARG / CCMP1375 / SS120) TaxID=167539 RepID=RLMH_PROMA|nr:MULTISPECIES: 23S rRNA (pseudouridine(1915)-N(3))-methyltransferase RlmH [Prochlorococcus]Q7VCH9.1 RecName: Full=Ribosomal RNA large subunit methyltransferase H; AltName: Full=23S rRNA (pseudouridine1915-N3)-methyltransferase; AltName: Full=23S rRNA m3Psi1915 methyltransferase; AltName: Full=rRNA (pseudouridine-N3-)-methyltransferase RlmH [Prochlorococcus marinus subsp. marinus str. CCMP1375]AAP99805.1 Uncharacterized conserved protein [Prochlorococcus marinus subsp. marinus str. CCMP1375]KGG
MLNPSRFRILAIGKVRKSWIQNGLEVYRKRLPGLSITEIRDGDIKKESRAIISSIKKDELLIALCEEGEKFTSMDFSHWLQNLGSSRIVFAIGGTNGLSQEVKTSADLCISLSALTFPHEMARLILAEQLYRAISIAKGSPYHRE